LDSPLVFFTALTALTFSCFTNQQELGPAAAFKGPWWFWLAATGVSLGATLSIKWVGLFTMAWVGSLTVLQLWVVLGDAKTVTPVCS
jgi:dolichyl-phosphate-mannose-protein mannosyltransferase